MSSALWVEYETEQQRLTLDVSQAATQKFGFLYQDRVITPKGVASIIGVLETIGAPPKLYVLYEGEPFVKAVDATPAEMSSWKKLADSTTAASMTMENTREFHHLREINFFGTRRTIVMQSANGPCPVIAIANALLLRGALPDIERLAVGRMDAVVTAKQLQDAVLEVIRSKRLPPPEFSETGRADGTLALLVKSPAFEQLRQKLSGPSGPDAMQRFYDGLFVEPIHDVVDGFASSEDAALFSLAGCKLVHGWIMDFTSDSGQQMSDALRTQSCSELQVTASLVDTDDGHKAQEFLAGTPTQTTELGINILSSELEEKQVVVMFRNNHFGAVVVHNGKLYSLVTDVVFTQRNDVVFQEVKVKDDGEFVDGSCSDLEPVVMRALEKFESRYSVEQIRNAVSALMNQPNDLFLMAIQEQIDGPKNANPNAAAAASGGGGGGAASSSDSNIVQGTVINGNTSAAAATVSNSLAAD